MVNKMLIWAIAVHIIYASYPIILPIVKELLNQAPELILNQDATKEMTKASMPVTDEDLKIISEQLFEKDKINLRQFINVNIQNIIPKNSDVDVSPLPLLSMDANVWRLPTFSAIKALYDNYEMDTSLPEDRTPAERAEEDMFVDAIMSTEVMIHLMRFLSDKGIVSGDVNEQKNTIRELWFNLYPRRKKGGVESSSSFEHIFLAEIRDNQVLGLHNWIYFYLMEASEKINYLGYIKNVQLNNGRSVLKFRSCFGDKDKPVSSMFIGSSPEFDIAVYTLCFLTRGNKSCRFYFGGKKVFVRIYTQTYLGKNYFGSAYPEI